MKKARDLPQIKSDLNRAKSQLKQLKSSGLFTTEDIKILSETYENTINTLEDEYEQTLKAIDVIEEEVVGDYCIEKKTN